MSSNLNPRNLSLRIIFAGTPDFAAVALQALIDSGHEVVAVYTQPDRPAGRGRKLKPGPVKQLAAAHDIPVYQPASLKNANEQQQLHDLNADVMVVAAYGLILPKVILDIPRYGCLNIHASLLPRWRGAAPIQRAILAGDSESGISIMQMDVGLDTGDILLRTAIAIEKNDTGGSLHDKLATQGAKDLLIILDQVAQQQLKPVKQDDAQASYAHKLDKPEAHIDWTQDADAIERLIRAFNPWPMAFTLLDGKPLRIYKAGVVAQEGDAGQILSADKTGIVIACGQQALRLLQLQLAGSKPMDTAAFMNGHGDKVAVGEKLP